MSLQQIQETPWKLKTELMRLATIPSNRLYFVLHGVAWGEGWKMFGRPLIQRHRDSEIKAGVHFQMRNWFFSNPLGVVHPGILATWLAGSKIVIGDHVGLTGTTICAANHIEIGDRVLVGANSTITDTDFHPLDPKLRFEQPQLGKTRPIKIGNDVFIGMNVMILKGTEIGDGSVIGAGSIVAGKFPSNVIIAGNPARVIREL